MLEEKPRVLVADDQEDVRVALDLLLRSEGFEVTTVDSPARAIAAIDDRRYHAALVDLNYTRDTTSGAEGLDLLRHVSAAHPELPLLVMTAWGTMEIAVAAMRRGARDFVMKPWDNQAVVKALRAQIARGSHAAKDMELARRVQSELLPAAAPRVAGLDVAARCVQAGAVGGDAYDFLELRDGTLGLVLADASGKGMPAALLMANLMGTLRSEIATRAPSAALRTVNRLFHASTATERYATLFLGLYDGATRTLRYANCGHVPPLWLRADGSLKRLQPTASAVGLLAEWDCEVEELRLAPGDVLALVSDGVTDATSPTEELFGEGQLESTLRAASGQTAQKTCDLVLDAVARFAGSDHEDDRTLLVARSV